MGVRCCASVCCLSVLSWLPVWSLGALLRAWADPQRFRLRWFTPKVEVALCGHATLATAATLLFQVGNVNST